MDPRPSLRNPAIDTQCRLTGDDTFQFACGPHVPCFTECCGRLDLLLTPYDALKLRRRLELSSDEFMDRYTVTRFRTTHGFPEVMMKMDKEAGKRCPFVTDQGCSVYESRPAACRIYPLGRASTRHAVSGEAREFFFTVREDHCRGFEESKTWKVTEWLQDQDLSEYNRMNDHLMDLYVLKSRRKMVQLSDRHLQMFLMACYHPEKFRRFVFDSPFLDRFEMEPDLIDAMRIDDTVLLEFAFRWLKFAFFQEPVLTIKAEAADRAKQTLTRQGE